MTKFVYCHSNMWTPCLWNNTSRWVVSRFNRTSIFRLRHRLHIIWTSLGCLWKQLIRSNYSLAVSSTLTWPVTTGLFCSHKWNEKEVFAIIFLLPSGLRLQCASARLYYMYKWTEIATRLINYGTSLTLPVNGGQEVLIKGERFEIKINFAGSWTTRLGARDLCEAITDESEGEVIFFK